MRISAPVFALLLGAVSVTFASQTPQPGQPTPPARPSPTQVTPPRGMPPRPGEQPPTGTAVMRGQVTSTDGTPLRRAQVRAFAADGRGGGSSTTDPQGKFEIKELPAGRYTVSATKAGYVSMQFGQRRADQPGGTILDVLDGQLVEKIGFMLPRGGVITGQVLDEFGEPIAGVQVGALRSRFMSGTRRMMSSGGDSTDDRGTFRIYGLAPGEYLVQGTLRPQMMMAPGMSASDSDGYAPSYYPGTANMAEAQRVAVKGGQEITGVNFALAATRLARVKGRVTSGAGEPGVSMMIMVANADPSMMPMSMMSGSQTRGDGTFQLVGLAPGNYTLTARSTMNPMGMEVGQARITVGNDDLDNVLIVTSRGASARGVITADDGTALPLRPQLVRIFAQNPDPNPDFMGGMPPTVNDDWTFEMSGLVGQRMLRASLSEGGEWFLKGVYLRDQDVTDTPIDFVPGQAVEGFHIVFTRKVTEVTGMVRDEKNQPVLGASVVIFPNDSARWTFGSRYMRTIGVDQQGRFSVKNLPPYDDYRIVAVTDLETGRGSDPEFLEAVRETAGRVQLEEGTTRAQDLKVIRAP